MCHHENVGLKLDLLRDVKCLDSYFVYLKQLLSLEVAQMRSLQQGAREGVLASNAGGQKFCYLLSDIFIRAEHASTAIAGSSLEQLLRFLDPAHDATGADCITLLIDASRPAYGTCVGYGCSIREIALRMPNSMKPRPKVYGANTAPYRMPLHALAARATVMYPWHRSNARGCAAEYHFRRLLRELTYDDGQQTSYEHRMALLQLIYATFIPTQTTTQSCFPGAGRYGHMVFGLLLGCDYDELLRLGDETWLEPVFYKSAPPISNDSLSYKQDSPHERGYHVVRASRLYERLLRMEAFFEAQCAKPFELRSPLWSGTHWLKRNVRFTDGVRMRRTESGVLVDVFGASSNAVAHIYEVNKYSWKGYLHLHISITNNT